MFGAMLTDSAGVPFYIMDTLPISLIDHRVYSIGGGGSGSKVADLYGSNQMYFTFVNCIYGDVERDTNAENIFFNPSTGIFELWASGAARTIHVYIFGFKYQIPSGYGLQVNDDQGRCVITHDTKVLKNVQKLGDQNNPQASGMNLRADLAGNWAIAPADMGYFAGVINQAGQPMPIVSRYVSSARFDGSTTRVRVGIFGNTSAGSGATGTTTNYRTTLTAVDVNNY